MKSCILFRRVINHAFIVWSTIAVFISTVSGHVSQDAAGAVGSSEEVEAAFPASLGSQTTFATDLLTAMHSNLPMPVQIDFICLSEKWKRTWEVLRRGVGNYSLVGRFLPKPKHT